MVFDYPNPGALAAYVAERLGAREPPMLTDLDRIARAVANSPRTTATRPEVAARLRRSSPRSTGRTDRPDERDADVKSAADEELFDLLDDELQTP